MAGGKGTNPIHNKKPKKVEKEDDDEDKANKERLKKEKSERDALAKQIGGKGKGPLNTGQQGIKKSGKK